MGNLIAAVKVENLGAVKTAGQFCIAKRTATQEGLKFGCPCGCGAIAFIGITQAEKRGDAWGWDGNREAPTLTPSLHQLNCGWHGHLIAGFFKSV